MTQGWWNDDDELLDILSLALREQREVPSRFVEAGKAAFAWRSIDAELAALAYDSAAAEAPTGAPIRAEEAAIRELTFAFRDASVYVQVTDGGLHGQIVPPQRGELEVHREGQPPARTEIDDQGWFSYTPLPRTPIRLLWRVAGSGTAMTDWLNL